MFALSKVRQKLQVFEVLSFDLESGPQSFWAFFLLLCLW